MPTGIEHGTVTLVADGTAIEVTTLRRDVATDGRRAVVAFTTDWGLDAMRRDFTVNAVYCDLGGRLFDPTGGLGDLARRRIRFIGDAATRIAEDYLRILRFFRFHAEIGRGPLDAEGLRACGAHAGGLANISRERIRRELLRLLAAPGAVPAINAMAAAGVLRAIGLRGFDDLALARLADIETALGRPGDGLIRFAALALGPAGGAAEIAEAFRLSGDERDRLLALETGSTASLGPGMSNDRLRELSYRLGRERLLDRLLMAWAASGAGATHSGWSALHAEAAVFVPPEFPLSGRDLVALGTAPGPALGQALARLETAWIASGFTKSKDELLKLG